MSSKDEYIYSSISADNGSPFLINSDNIIILINPSNHSGNFNYNYFPYRTLGLKITATISIKSYK